MHDKAGDDHTVLVTLNSFYTTPILQEGLGVDVTEFTPIGRMALDTFVLWVNADSEVDSLETYVEAAKSGGKDWKMGGTGSGQEDSIVTAMLESEFGLDMTYIPFEGGGTVAKNLVGGHIDSTVNNPAEQNEFWRAGNSRPLVQFTEERMETFPDVPTAKELGHDVVYFMQRSINGPPEMSKEAQDWYVQLFQTLFESEEWQAYCESEGLFCDEWMADGDLAEFHQAQYDRHKTLIDKVGATAITGE
jgi:tripartite-type tricarboxylate transporter receptor subunit TctC